MIEFERSCTSIHMRSCQQPGRYSPLGMISSISENGSIEIEFPLECM